MSKLADLERARLEIRQEWFALPEAERQTENDALAFALRMSPRYRFKRVTDSYQVIKVWVFQWLPPHAR
jgi:hypothetical protein